MPEDFNNIKAKAQKALNIEKNELTFVSKFFYGFAGMPYQMFFTAISVFTSVFLLEKAEISSANVSVILFISRLIDAITDPIYGFIVNKTKFTKYGRMKPWMFISLPFCVVAYLMVWYVPENFDEYQLFIWYLVMHSLLFTLLTGIRIPHISMVMYLTTSEVQRQSATVFEMSFEIIGVLLLLIIQIPLTNDNASDCLRSTQNVTQSVETNLTTISSYYTLYTSLTGDIWHDQKYFFFACLIASIFLAANVLLFIFVKEINLKSFSASSKNISLIKECKRIFTFKPYLILISAFVVNQIAIQSCQANIQLYFEFGYYRAKDLFNPALLVLLGSAILFIPLWQFIISKIGKRKSFFIGNFLLIPLLICCLVFREKRTELTVIFFVAVVIGANSFTTAFVVPWAILPETLDAYYLKYKSRPDALFYTFFLLGTKIALSFYLGFSQLLLSYVGFKNKVCAEDQDPIVSETIIYMFAPIPIVCLLISSAVIFFFPINEELAKENMEKIRKFHTNGESNKDNLDDINNEYFCTTKNINISYIDDEVSSNKSVITRF